MKHAMVVTGSWVRIDWTVSTVANTDGSKLVLSSINPSWVAFATRSWLFVDMAAR